MGGVKGVWKGCESWHDADLRALHASLPLSSASTGLSPAGGGRDEWGVRRGAEWRSMAELAEAVVSGTTGHDTHLLRALLAALPLAVAAAGRGREEARKLGVDLPAGAALAPRRLSGRWGGGGWVGWVGWGG